MTTCPACKSESIISARHDSDWSGGSRIDAVNSEECYNDEDLFSDGDVMGFGDIDILVCLACDYTWQRYGSFKFPTLDKGD
jgi:hypothetical protein